MFMAEVLSSAVIYDDMGNLHSDEERVGDFLGVPACSSTHWSRIAFPALFEHQEQFLQQVKKKDNIKLASTHHTVVQLDYQAMKWRMQPRALRHLTNGHFFYYSFFLTASVPKKK